MDKLPRVNIAVIGIICSSLGGMVWYASEQASIIANLEETVAVLDAQSNTTDKVNMIRDVEQNKERIDEIIDYIVEIEEDNSEAVDEIYQEFEDVYETQEGFLLQFNQIVKLQARIKTLENTLEFLARRPSLSDGR